MVSYFSYIFFGPLARRTLATINLTTGSISFWSWDWIIKIFFWKCRQWFRGILPTFLLSFGSGTTINRGNENTFFVIFLYFSFPLVTSFGSQWRKEKKKMSQRKRDILNLNIMEEILMIPWNFLIGSGMKIANDRKVIPDPIDDRKFQEWKS